MAEVAALKMQVSALEGHQTTTLQSTLSTKISKLEKTLANPYLHQLQEHLSQLSEQLKAHNSRPVSSKTASGSGNTQTRCANSPYTTTHLDTQCNPESQCSGRSQLETVQIKRKRKSSSVVTKNCQSHTDSNSVKVGRARSQGDLSPSFDIDLTQCSPSGCSQVLSNSMQRPSSVGTTVSKTASKKKALQIQQAMSPSGGPGAKRKRTTCTGRVGKKRSAGGRRGLLATPKATRRSGRLSKKNAAPITVQAPPGISNDEQPCVKLVKPEFEMKVQNRGNRGDDTTSRGDVCEDWLDFNPPEVFADTKPLPTHTYSDNVSHSVQASKSWTVVTFCFSQMQSVKFQRSSEAAKRRLAITEQMSSTLAGSDSVLRELLHSSTSLLSP